MSVTSGATSERPRPLVASSAVRAVRWSISAVVWLAAGLYWVWFASTTKVGPIVATFSPTHGLHEGDVFALLACIAAAGAVTLAVWRGGER